MNVTGTTSERQPPPAAARPIPFEVAIRQLRQTALYDRTDRLCREAEACARLNDPDGEAEAGRRYNLVWDEIDRRAAAKGERDARRAARIRAEADRWYAARGTGGAR